MCIYILLQYTVKCIRIVAAIITNPGVRGWDVFRKNSLTFFVDHIFFSPAVKTVEILDSGNMLKPILNLITVIYKRNEIPLQVNTRSRLIHDEITGFKNYDFIAKSVYLT